MATFSYDYDAKIVTASGSTSVQEVINSVAVEQAQLHALNNKRIAYWEGKLEVSTGLNSGISLKLFNGWRLAFPAQSGPAWVAFEITGGNVIAYTGYDETTPQQIPIAPTAFVASNYAKSTEAALLNAGSGVAVAVWGASTAATTSGTFGHALVLGHYGGRISIDTKSGVDGAAHPAGTFEAPVKTLASALALRTLYGINAFEVRGNLTATEDASDTVWYGAGEEAELNFANQVFSDAEVHNMKLTGTLGSGPVNTFDCELNGVGGYYGTNRRPILTGNEIGMGGNLLLIQPVSGVAGGGTPAVSANGGAYSLQVRGLSGGLEVRDVSHAGAKVSLDVNQGHLVLAASCTDGDWVVRGIGKRTDVSSIPPAQYDDEGWVSRIVIVDGVLDAATSDHVVPGSVGAAIVAAAAQGLENCRDDNFVYVGAPAGVPSSFRRRVFATSAAAGAATDGAVDGADGEMARFQGTAVYSGTEDTDVLTSMTLLRVL